MFDTWEGCIVDHLTLVDVFAGSSDVKGSGSVKVVVGSGPFLFVEISNFSDGVEAGGDTEGFEDPIRCKMVDSVISRVEDLTSYFVVEELCSV